MHCSLRNIERTASCTIPLVRTWDMTVQDANTYLELPAVTVNVSSGRLWIRSRHAINFEKPHLHSQAHASLHSKSVGMAMKRTMYGDDSGSNPGLRILLLSGCDIDNSSRGTNIRRVSPENKTTRRWMHLARPITVAQPEPLPIRADKRTCNP